MLRGASVKEGPEHQPKAKTNRVNNIGSFDAFRFLCLLIFIDPYFYLISHCITGELLGVYSTEIALALFPII